MKTKMKFLSILLGGFAISASAQTITAISPDNAPQGTTDLEVTFTISNTMLPPDDALPSSVSIGPFSGTSIARPSSGTVTALFDIDFSEPAGAQDAVITFVAPFGTEMYTGADGFTITEGADTAPMITEEPTSIYANTNSPAQFSLKVSGSMPITYQWQKELVDLTDATNRIYAIDAVLESDVGEYRCMVVNPFGSATSAVATLSIDTNVFAEGYVLIETGQAGCYDTNGLAISDPAPGEDFAGQDAQYEGTTMSYRNNGNGTTTDLGTGLMWEQVPQTEGLSWQEAVDYCNSLELGGYSDWRMPSCKELFSISDFSDGWPYINTNYFDLAIEDEISKDEQYWASDYYVGVTVEGGSDAAFGVNHVTGHIKAYAALVSGQFGNYVRAVRGNTYGENKFQDNGNGTITDAATGLMWQQADNGAGMDWPAALAYAEGLELGGYRDWRLPNIKELQSILDYTKSPTATNSANLGPAINTDFFSVSTIATNLTNTNPDYGYYWSSTSAYFSKLAPGNYYAWYIAIGTAINDEGADFHGAGGVRFDTMVDGGPAAEEEERVYNYVLCVRGGAESADTDTDDDGLTDWYEYNYAGDIIAMVAADDDDDDGISNENEEAAGTIPTDADSIFQVTGLSDTNITWTSELDRSYTLQYATNLTNEFQSVESGIATTAPTNNYLFESDVDTVFFRVIVE